MDHFPMLCYNNFKSKEIRNSIFTQLCGIIPRQKYFIKLWRKDYEEKAAEYLVRQGMKILCRNFRCRQGEIDVIGLQGEYLVFVEVKFRASAAGGFPEESVGWQKQKRICRTALYYLYTHPAYETRPVRYDVVAVCGGRIRWYKDAFEHHNE